jgi:hypothetical protein
MTNHTFRDDIERNATRHPNGGGWVAEGAVVSATAYIGRHAEVISGTIYGGTIEGGTIEGGAIYGGTIYDGTIWGGTIEGGTIYGGTIWGGTIEGGTIWGGTIEGGTIYGGTIEGGTIYGGTIEGGTIRGGEVTRDVTFICGCIPYPVTITDTHAGVGCKWFTHAEWELKGAEIAAEERQTPEMLALLLMFIRMHNK